MGTSVSKSILFSTLSRRDSMNVGDDEKGHLFGLDEEGW